MSKAANARKIKAEAVKKRAKLSKLRNQKNGVKQYVPPTPTPEANP